jgi:DNA-binding NtrC family response regulator
MAKIVVQDTDHSILEVLSLALENEGYTVYSTGSCDDILESIDKMRPHVVMLDVKLANTECLDACKLIKQKYPDLPVIALSCNNNINDVYAAHCFDDYIEKPFDLDHLYTLLRKYIPSSLADKPAA